MLLIRFILKAFPRIRTSLTSRPSPTQPLRLKLSRFSRRIALCSSTGILRWLHPERARALLASGDARLRSSYASGRIDEIILTSRLFETPQPPRAHTKPRNLYLSRSSQDTNAPRGLTRSITFHA